MTLVTLCTPTLVLLLSLMEIWNKWLAHVFYLSDKNLKDQKPPSSQLFKQPLPQIKIPTTLSPQIKIIFGYATATPPLFLEAHQMMIEKFSWKELYKIHLLYPKNRIQVPLLHTTGVPIANCILESLNRPIEWTLLYIVSLDSLNWKKQSRAIETIFICR